MPSLRARAAVLATSAALAAAAPGCDGEEPTAPRLGEAQLAACDFGPGLPGIDVSYYQGTIDWPTVAAEGWRWAIARVSHSTSFIDPEFQANWEGIRAAGMVRGVYQYFEPDEDPVPQAQVLIDAVGQLGEGDLPAVIDVEEPGASSATYVENVRTWIELVEAGTGKKPIIYTGSYFWDDNLGSDAFADHPLWIAHYTEDCPRIPTTYGADWTFWQYTSTGGIPGIPSANVDKNWFRGDEAALLALAGGGSIAATKVEVRAPSAVIVGETFDVSVRYRNTGARPWDEATFLGTTEPRDRPSPFADPSWVSDHRVVASGPVAAGEEHTFSFTMRAPDAPGAYVEHLGLVQEGVAWFADQGGPPDDAVRIPLQVMEGGDGGSGAATTTSGGGGDGPAGAGGGEAEAASGAGGEPGPSSAADDGGGCAMGVAARRDPWGALAPLGAALAWALARARRARAAG